MAVDKLVDSTQLDSDLTDVADEIRTAGGTLLPLSFPDDYVVAIGDIGNTEIKTASGSIVHFEDALARKAQDLTVAVEPVQSGSGDPAPDNVRPISGWTGANVTRTGKNLLDTKNFAPTSSSSGGITTVQNQNGTFAASGTASGVVNLWLRGNYGASNPVLKLYAGKQYIIKDVMLYRGTTQVTPTCYIGSAVTYSPQSDVLITGVRASTPNGATLDTTIYPYVTDSADTEWQEFGTTYPITFPSEAGTVYGGTLDVTTGKLTVDRAMVDMGSLEYLYNPTVPGFPFFASAIFDMAGGTDKYLCSNYANSGQHASIASVPDMACMTIGQQFRVRDSRYDTAAAFNAAVSGVQLCYELATPIVYDLAPTEVTTLLGTNNVWADTGDSTIQYIAPKAQIPSAQGVYF